MTIQSITMDFATPEKRPEKNTQFRVNVSRNFSAGVRTIRDEKSKNTEPKKEDVIRVMTFYVFDYGKDSAKISFQSMFSIKNLKNEIEASETIKNDVSLKRIAAILSPQESVIIRDLFNKFGITINTALPFGSDFES